MTHVTITIALAFFGGLVLGFLLGRARSGDGLDVDSRERKQMWIREGR